MPNNGALKKGVAAQDGKVHAISRAFGFMMQTCQISSSHNKKNLRPPVISSHIQSYPVIAVAGAMKLAWLRRRRASNAKAFDHIGPSPPSTPSTRAAGRQWTPSEGEGEENDVNLLEDLPLNLKSPQGPQGPQLPSLTDRHTDGMARSAPVKRNGTGSITLSSVKAVASASVNGRNSDTLSDFQKGDQRRLSLPCPMPKSFSYSGDDLSEIVEAIESEAPTLDWFRDLWVHLLAGKRSGMVKLPVKSLGGWVQVYNSWQALGNWSPGDAPVLLDAAQLQAVTASPKLKVMEWMKVFGGTGGTKSGAVKLNMPMFLCTCILLANTISKKQKLRFLLGIFDENDSGTFDQDKFRSFISAFFQEWVVKWCAAWESSRLLVNIAMFTRDLSKHRSSWEVCSKLSIYQEMSMFKQHLWRCLSFTHLR